MLYKIYTDDEIHIPPDNVEFTVNAVQGDRCPSIWIDYSIVHMWQKKSRLNVSYNMCSISHIICIWFCRDLFVVVILVFQVYIFIYTFFQSCSLLALGQLHSPSASEVTLKDTDKLKLHHNKMQQRANCVQSSLDMSYVNPWKPILTKQQSTNQMHYSRDILYGYYFRVLHFLQYVRL